MAALLSPWAARLTFPLVWPGRLSAIGLSIRPAQWQPKRAAAAFPGFMRLLRLILYPAIRPILHHGAAPGGSMATTAVACPAGTSTTECATVGPDGGTIIMSNTPATAGAPLTLTIPPNALTEAVTIRITETTRSSPGEIAQWSPTYYFEPEALTLSIPAIVEVPFIVGSSATDLDQKLSWPSASDTCTLAALDDSHAYGQFTRASVTRLGWGLNALLMPKNGSTCDPPP